MRKLPAFSDKNAKKELSELCESRGIAPDLIHQLTDILAAHTGRARRRGMYDEFDLVLSEYLREQADE